MGKSLFGGGGEEKLRAESFEIIREHSHTSRVLGDDLFANPIQYNSGIFTDDDGNDRSQIIYSVTGSLGEARVDAEKKKVDGTWDWEYIILSTQYQGSIYV